MLLSLQSPAKMMWHRWCPKKRRSVVEWYSCYVPHFCLFPTFVPMLNWALIKVGCVCVLIFSSKSIQTYGLGSREPWKVLMAVQLVLKQLFWTCRIVGKVIASANLSRCRCSWRGALISASLTLFGGSRDRHQYLYDINDGYESFKTTKL